MKTVVRHLSLFGLVLAMAGCSRGVAWLDQRDQDLPLMQRAAARAAEGDVESAIRLYTKALDQDPDSARAHLDMALLQHDYKKDYVGAIYHYERYLELRPDTEKRSMIEERSRLA
ncbi:MAG: tetratricopeptide repeat protein, partial [Verrucomicrobia bacterium]|nr:tetratricopeptide repeat protein [Verrucomicrobiota bacterium]